MADLTVVPATIIKAATAKQSTGISDLALTIGQVVYKKANEQLALAFCAGTQLEATVEGITLSQTAAAGQPVEIMRTGGVPLGTGTQGDTLWLSINAGFIANAEPVTTGNFIVPMGLIDSSVVAQISDAPVKSVQVP